MEEVYMDQSPEEKEPEGTVDEGTVSSTEEAFMQGYSEDEEIVTCDECGSALHAKPLVKEIDGEEHKFCSADCAKEFEESIGN